MRRKNLGKIQTKPLTLLVSSCCRIMLQQFYNVMKAKVGETSISKFEMTEPQSTMKAVLSNHIKQDTFFTFQTGGCLLLHESSVESSGAFCTTFVQQ